MALPDPNLDRRLQGLDNAFASFGSEGVPDPGFDAILEAIAASDVWMAGFSDLPKPLQESLVSAEAALLAKGAHPAVGRPGLR